MAMSKTLLARSLSTLLPARTSNLFGFNQRPAPISPEQITNRTHLLNYLIWRYGYRRYLEIGVRHPRDNFRKIRAEHKWGVDPNPRRRISHAMSSDEFFEEMSREKERVAFDLIFIDGLHLAEQVEKDIDNALRFLKPRGAIVLHDVNPLSEEAQSLDYDGKKTWNGTVWKAWVRFRVYRPDLSMWVIDMDHGCGVICRGRQTCLDIDVDDYDSLSYAKLESQRERWLNLVDVQSFIPAFEQRFLSAGSTWPG